MPFFENLESDTIIHLAPSLSVGIFPETTSNFKTFKVNLSSLLDSILWTIKMGGEGALDLMVQITHLATEVASHHIRVLIPSPFNFLILQAYSCRATTSLMSEVFHPQRRRFFHRAIYIYNTEVKSSIVVCIQSDGAHEVVR